MSTSVKCGGCKDKSWRKCCDKCLDILFESYICGVTLRIEIILVI